MRIVLDTNVLVSAALKRNSTPAAAVRVVEEHYVLLKSTVTQRQLFDVVGRPYFTPLIGEDTRIWLQKLMATAVLIEVVERIAACRDPTDDKFLELAVNGGADLIVSGDANLLELHPFRGIPVITPAAFIEQTRR